MRRILYVSPVLPLNITAGNIVHTQSIINLLKSNFADIDYIYYGKKSIKTDFNSSLKSLYKVHDNIIQKDKKFLLIDEWISDELIKFVSELSSKIKYDDIFVDYAWMSAIFKIPSLKNSRKYLVAHDSFANRDQIFKKYALKQTWFYTNEQEEQKGLERADVILAITNEDKEIYEKLINKPVMLYYNYEPLKISSFKPKQKYVLGYIASDNSLNRYSINAFLKSFPIKDYKNLEFKFAGSICSHIEPRENLAISKLGYVDDIETFYDNCDFMILPMCDSTGLKMKTLEAIAYGKPFIATQQASNGLDVKFTEHKFSSIKEMGAYFGNFADSGFIKSIGPKLKDETSRLSNILTAKSFDYYCNVSSVIFDHDPLYKYKVSVVIPCYNCAKTIYKCFDSILNDRLREVEIVAVNDASTDNTLEVLQAYPKNDRIKIINLEKNGGQGPARNIGLENADGEYVYFVDSDDYLKKDTLYHLYTKAKGDNLDLCSIKRNYLTKRPLPFISSFPSCMGIIRTRIIKDHMIEQPSLRTGEDGVFSNMVLNHCESIGVAENADYVYVKKSYGSFSSSLSNPAGLIPVIEQYLFILRNYYRDNRINIDRYFMFIYDEPYYIRFLKILSKQNIIFCRSIYNIIKCELSSIIENVSDTAKNLTDRNFLAIINMSFDQWIENHQQMLIK